MSNEKNSHLQETLKSLQDALGQWESVSTVVEAETDEVRKRTRELLTKLSEQIKALEL